MTAAIRVERPEAWDWRRLADLGEILVNTTSLAAQRERIISTTNRLIKGDVDVWLDENLLFQKVFAKQRVLFLVLDYQDLKQ